MVRIKKPKGVGLGDRERPRSGKTGRSSSKIVTVPASASSFLAERIETGSRVEFLVEEGVVEIHDSRLFRASRDSFCRTMVEQAVGPGLAQRAEIRLGSARCRMEFEPGRFDREGLAKKVVTALNAASSSSIDRTSESDASSPRWTTLTAVAKAGGRMICETLVDLDGRVIRRTRPAVNASRVSIHSGRPLRNPSRKLVRAAPPKARPTIAGDHRGMGEPVALALSGGFIFPRLLPSKRLVNLGLAGGSFAMAVAGVILPGIPALPFLLLTGHYLIRSSPELCQRLEQVPAIGSLLKRVEGMGSLKFDGRSLLKAIGVTVLAISAFVIFHPPLPLVILLETGIMACYGLREVRKPPALADQVGQARLCLA